MIEASTQQDKDFGRHASMQEKGIVPVGDCGIGTTYGQQMGRWARQSPGKSGSRLVIIWRRPRRLATKVENVNGC